MNPPPLEQPGVPPLVSVTISSFNYAKFIAEAVQSALDQTYPSVEVIVVDDGSTDETSKVIERFRSDPRVQFFPLVHQGHSRTKNVGFSLAKGEFVAFLDADDAWEKDKLEKQMALFKNRSVGAVYSRMRSVSERGEPMGVVVGKYLTPRRGWITDALYVDNFIPYSAAVVRRECFKKVGVLDEAIEMGNDWDFWLRLSLHYQFDFVDEPLVRYRVGHANQMSHKLDTRHRCAEDTMKRFLAKHPNGVSRSAQRKAWAYTYSNRGHHHRTRNLWTSNRYFFRAWRANLWDWHPLKSIAKNIWLGIKSIRLVSSLQGKTSVS